MGTLAAALITQVASGVRERRQWRWQREQELLRWRHEREQEEGRWEREKAERQEQWEREDIARSRQERLASYSELLQQLDSFRSAISSRLPVDGSGPKKIDAAWRSEVMTLANALELTRAKVRLFASVETDKACGEVFVRVRRCWASFSGGMLDRQERIDVLRSDLWNLGALSAELLKAIRWELGLDVAQ
ncbi:hypothetical protein AB0J68_17040 [Micromonospora sp. NPDC049580]|uniref:hypothetical protein n=1 Tax=Micromonospora sp. NPDC049580 TaxID=3154832 RepID=UPI00343B9920